MSANETVRDRHLSVVLNSGSTILESATIPVRWFLDDEGVEAQPTHILIIDQSEKDISPADANEDKASRPPVLGRRYVAKVGRGSDFLQFFRPGRHILNFIAVKSDGSEFGHKGVRMFLKQDVGGGYISNVWFIDEWNKFGVAWFPDHKIVGWCRAEVEVPRELFADNNETPFRTWVNGWYESPPRDECQFRGRIPFALLVKPPLWAVGTLIQYLVVCPWMSLMLIVGRLAVLFWGFRNTPVFEGMRNVWQSSILKSLYCTDFSFRRYPGGRYYYAVWLMSYDDVSGRTTRYMPITGLELAILGFSVTGGYLALSGLNSDTYWFALFPALLFFVLAGAVCESVLERWNKSVWFIKLKARCENGPAARLMSRPFRFLKVLGRWLSKPRPALREEIAANRRQEKSGKPAVEMAQEPPRYYFDWLKRELHQSNRPARVDAANLPRAFKNPLIHTARMRFKAVKAKVCRPFPVDE